MFQDKQISYLGDSRGATNLSVPAPGSGEGEGRSALSHLIDFTNLGNLLHPLHLHVECRAPFLFRENLLFATNTIIQTLP